MITSRRQFMALIAAVATADGLWVPGSKLISIPRPTRMIWGRQIDLTPDEAHRILTISASRLRAGLYPEVWYNGMWREVYRIDLCKQVATGRYSGGQSLRQYAKLAKSSFAGAYINPNGPIEVIDRLTDG